MEGKNQPYRLVWRDQFKSVLKNKEMSITELAEKFEKRSETISRWVNLLEAEGLVESKFVGLKRMVRLR